MTRASPEEGVMAAPKFVTGEREIVYQLLPITCKQAARYCSILITGFYDLIHYVWTLMTPEHVFNTPCNSYYPVQHVKISTCCISCMVKKPSLVLQLQCLETCTFSQCNNQFTQEQKTMETMIIITNCLSKVIVNSLKCGL